MRPAAPARELAHGLDRLLAAMATVTELPVRTCQFHGGRTDAAGFLVFCGKPVRRGTSYCEAHYWRVYQRPPAFGVKLPAGDPAAKDDLVEAGLDAAVEREAA